MYLSSASSASTAAISSGSGSMFAEGNEEKFTMGKMRTAGTTGKEASKLGRELERWMREFPGVIRNVGGPGARKHVEELQRELELPGCGTVAVVS